MSTPELITVDDVMEALATSGVLETFCQLPVIDQERFSRLIGEARNDESQWRRIEALVMALKTGPFQPSEVGQSTAYIEMRE